MQGHVVVAAIIRDGDRVLLCHRSPHRRWYPDVWDFPGGHIEAGERPVAALQRELREELGIEIEPDNIRTLVQVVRLESDLDLTLFLVEAWTGTVSNLEPEEHDHVEWFHAEELAPLAFADDSYPSMLYGLLKAT